MKIGLSELNPNPFKKFINGGKLDKARIELLKESIKKDGFWDNVICRKVDGKYEIAYGHHRLEAAKQELGKDYVVDIPVKSLTDEMMVRILGNENAMQNEEYAIYQVDQVLLAKKWLEGTVQPVDSSKPTHKQEVGVREISAFLGEKNWSKSKVAEYLHLAAKLDPKILGEMKNAANTGKLGEFSITHANYIARIPDKDKQMKVYKEVKKNGFSKRATEAYVDSILGKTRKGGIRPVEVDKSGFEAIIKSLEGQEIVWAIQGLTDSLKKVPLSQFNVKEQAFIRVMLKELMQLVDGIITKKITMEVKNEA